MSRIKPIPCLIAISSLLLYASFTVSALAAITIEVPPVTVASPLLQASFGETVTRAWYSLDGGIDTITCYSCSGFEATLNNELPQGAQGMTGWWHFQSVNANSYTPDSSGAGNDARLRDGNPNNSDGNTLPQLIDGKFGKALEFDGIDDYVDAGNNPSLNFLDTTQAITVEAWVYPTNYTGHNSSQWYIASKLSYPNKGWWLYLKNGGIVSFSTCNGTTHSATTPEAIPLNQWTHIAASSNGSTNRVFINGVEKASAVSGALIDADAVNFKFSSSNSDYGFKGAIDEVRLYNRALSPEEIKANYFLRSGAHSVTVYTLDNAGNTNSAMASFTVDSEAPQITFDSPVNRVVYDSDIPVDITFNEPVSGVFGIFNGLKIKLTQDASNSLKYHALRKNQLGNISASIYACDLLGNCNTTSFWIYASPDAWMHSTYEEFVSGTLTNMDAQKDGHITLKRKNLLDNPSFEMDDMDEKFGWFNRNGLAASWNFWGTGYGTYSPESKPSLDLDSTSGKYSQRIDFAPSSDAILYLSQSADATCCADYAFSVYAKIDNPSNLEAALRTTFIKKTGEMQSYLKTVQSDWVSPTAFTRLSITSSAPTGTNTIRSNIMLKPKFSGASGILWVDSAQLEEGSSATAFSYGYENKSGEYISPLIDMGNITMPYKIEWTSSVPYGDINFKARSADTLSNLQTAQWYGPTGAGDSYNCIEAAANLLSNPSLEADSDGDGIPDYTKKASYGTGAPVFSYVSDAYDGSKAVKVEYPSYSSGSGARWDVFYNGALEKGAQYIFGLWHKENKDIGYVKMFAAASYSDGTSETLFSDYVSTSQNWKQDKILFRAPTEKNITKLWLRFELSRSAGYIISDSYSLQKAEYLCEKKINPVHANTRYLQYKASLSTTDPQFTPSLHDVTIRYGKSLPEIKWINALDSAGLQKYAFYPGEAATIKPQIVDYNGAGNIKNVKMNIYDGSGAKIDENLVLAQGDAISDIEKYYLYNYVLPSGANGMWKFEVTAESADGALASENIFIRIKQSGQISPANSMPIGVINGFLWAPDTFNATNETQVLADHAGADIWKFGARWSGFEGERGVLNDKSADTLQVLLDSAQASGAKVQFGIGQQMFPAWANNGNADSKARYDYDKTKRLMDLWVKLAEIVKDHPAFDSYLIINEENHVYDADAYLRATEKIASAIRSVDPNPNHRITIRPNSQDSYIRTRIAQGGTQNVDYGTGAYPTSASWFNPSYESPVSETSFLRLGRIKSTPLAYGWKGSVGEFGFYNRPGVDNFGDDEKLIGFERALKIAYDQGKDEFMMWGGGFRFTDYKTYFPKLREFRDAVIKQPRKNEFDVRVLIDNNEFLYTLVSWTGHYQLNMSNEPYYRLVKYLDENGYSWFYTHSNAASLQSVNYKRTIKLSEAKWASEEDIKYILDHNGIKAYSGPALQFDGTDDYVNSTNLKLGNGDFTVEAWVNTERAEGISPNNRNTIYSAGTWWLLLGYNKVILQKLESPYPSVAASVGSIQNNVWYYIAATKQGDAITLYINGRKSGQGSLALKNGTKGIIGRPSSTSTDDFKGQIAEPRIYSRALSSEEIRAAYYNNIHSADGLVLHLPFNEASGDIAYDASGSHNDGMIFGATRTTVQLPEQVAPLTPSGSKFMWPDNTNYSYSMTGMGNPYEVSFPGGCSQCDVFALTEAKIRLYAGQNTAVRIKSPGNGISSVNLNGENWPFSQADDYGAISLTTSSTMKTNDIIFGTYPLGVFPAADVNQDGSVDILDLRLVALHFGEATTSPYPRYDVNSDATVDILDLRLVAGGM